MPSNRNRWEHFAHGADIGVRGIGVSMQAAFEQAALALTAVVADPQLIDAQQRVDIACSAPDPEVLLVDWLNAIVFEMATRHMLFSRFEIELTEDGLQGSAWGEPVDKTRHRPVVEVKGATYTSLSVNHREDGEWVAQCVVDV